MVDQTSVAGNGSRAGSVVSNIADLSSDVATLVELQARLAAIELKDNTRRASAPAAWMAVASSLLLASLPVVLIGASELLATALNLTQRGWAYLIVAAAASVIGVVVAVLAWRRLVSGFDGFRRSREELTRNIAWIRTVLVYSGRPAPRSRR
jgi:hypothetical protein